MSPTDMSAPDMSAPDMSASDVSAATQLSDRLASIVETQGRGVVRVDAGRRSPSSGIVWSDGVVVTAHHTIEREESIEVVLPDGKPVPGTLAGRDPTTDLAVIRIPAMGLERPAWSEAGDLKVGHLVIAVGRPGRTLKATLGMVSRLGESWRTYAGGRIDRYLETDLALYPGFSGSMLVDLAGRVIGLNTSGLRRGLSLGVPASTVRRVAEVLLARGQTQRGFLGIGTYPVNLPASLNQRLRQATALIVLSVQPQSPAERAGMLLGDVLLSLDARPLAGIGDLLELLDEERIGAECPAQIVRAGEVMTLRVTIGGRNAR